MPIYEYLCLGKCKNVFETISRMSEPKLRNCPTCNGKVKYLISASNFKIDGPGARMKKQAQHDKEVAKKKGLD